MAKKDASPASETSSTPAPKPDGVRDGIEAVVIAFVLAFMFRTFEAEAFVIPTGSMAPGLMGAHHDLTCKYCGYQYQVNSHELDEKIALEHAREVGKLYEDASKARARGDSRAVKQSEDNIADANQAYANRRTVEGTCPICRYTMDLEKPTDSNSQAFPGDRLIVTKFPYEFGQPKRFDVAVFKYPHGPRENYIKRIVGLPDENIRLFHGDVFTSRAGSDDALGIVQKPEDKLLAMAQIVHDNDYVVRPDGSPDPLLAAGWPARWHGGVWQDGEGVLKFDRAESGWKSEDSGRSFAIGLQESTARPHDWLRYQHIVPSAEVWSQALQHKTLPTAAQAQQRPQLISDFCAYNTNLDLNEARGAINTDAEGHRAIGLGLHWVGDLMLECDLDVRESEERAGAVTLELVEGSLVDEQGARLPCRFQCRIDLTSGQATLHVLGVPGNDWSRPARSAATAIRGPGRYTVRFANFDDQLLLWVNGRRVAFDHPTEYQFASAAPLARNNRPTEADLAPAGIQVEHAAVEVDHLRVKRDIFYIATHGAPGQPLTDYEENSILTANPSEATQREFMSNPGLWSNFDRLRQIEFTTGPDDFLPLGDNSPQSADGRLWGNEPFVPRRLLIGEALFIYWPHSWMFPVPNVKEMGFVR